jgi:NAD-dependent deacetylase
MAKVVLFSGAGISAESGISTFRDSGGLWDQYDISVICNYDSLDKHEALTIEFYDKRRKEIETKKPNKAHIEIAKLKAKYPQEIAIITQNVDNLFEKANAKEVIHLHGFLPDLRCRSCHKIFTVGYAPQKSFNGGICPKCGGELRPHIVFFGEQAPMYQVLSQELQDCEFFVVIGTSGSVVGVNHIAEAVSYSILNNLEPSSAINDRLFDRVIYNKASKAIDAIVQAVEAFLEKDS